ncbi:MAG: hypothetical protein A2946_02870 [Candidatus Liptonbacteria bacterium RIFCSPLOWO2_01_FULL_53_13]|uniref:Endonuclease/exonuclease/phosphatase domain-containing protein n=1 Tax=Candidatus Liptonbacteria bacterium RIFCSPLOWO2_01_FULL_53_13 TaxID=1798651 RepID=A0A1G2CN80_9BACT|nr:MAG: hypothetical protein A2946_02870 [Candidatus Liptonbacteria bacterium RIFCSPLOWO2_01_FULL_53_13]
MKLISLNIWGGTIYEPLMAFLREHAPTTDVFCFQEVFDSPEREINDGAHLNIFEELRAALPDFSGFFEPAQKGLGYEGAISSSVALGQALFVKQTLRVITHGVLPLFGETNGMTAEEIAAADYSKFPTNLIHARIASKDRVFTLGALHGISQPGEKLDNEPRLEQSRRIVDFISRTEGPHIICGDFNLMPDTESIAMIERADAKAGQAGPPSQELRRAGMRNLIKDFHIKATRNAISHEKWAGYPLQYFADYTFVSPEISVKNFTVPDVPASDHMPMILEFEI